MCGRYRLSRRKQILAEHFEAIPFDDDWEPRYNIAPTQPVPVIRQHPKEPKRVLSLMRWGLVPSWARDISGSARMILSVFRVGSSMQPYRRAQQISQADHRDSQEQIRPEPECFPSI